MPNITLPDGSIKRFDAPVSVADVAASIGPGLAKAALAGSVDGKVVDTSHRIERDASLAIITAKDPARHRFYTADVVALREETTPTLRATAKMEWSVYAT